MRIKAFIKRFQFEYVYNVLKETFIRFPLSVICCTLGTLLFMLEAHSVNLLSNDNMARWAVFFVQGLALFTALKLFIEGSGLKDHVAMLLMALAVALMAVVAFIPEHFNAAHLFFGAALSLSMIFAPYILRNSSEDSIWYFNYLNGMGLVIAGISSFVLWAGLSAVVGSLNYLFPTLEVSGSFYFDIWLFSACFFGPIAFMYQIPRQFDFAADECKIPKGVFFLANYLVVPLVLIYTFILYVYFAKIVGTWELPKGNLAYMVTGFGSVGIAVRLAVFPMRMNGTVLLQQFYKYFFYLLVIPLVLLAIGIYTRIHAYGITEERYAIVLCLVWLAGLTGYHLVRPARAHLKHVPQFLAVLFVLAAFGPWGAVPLSTASQVSRLESMLENNGLLADGTVVKATKDVPFTERKEISAILQYLHDEQREEAIETLVAPFIKEITDKQDKLAEDNCRDRRFTRCYYYYDRPQRIMKAWGMEYVSQYEQPGWNDYIEVRANSLDWYQDIPLKVSPYEYILRFYTASYSYSGGGDWSTERVIKENGVERMKIRFSTTREGKMTVTRRDGDKDGASVTFELLPLLEKLHDERITDIKEGEEGKMTLSAETEGLKVQLRLSSIRGRIVAGRMQFEHAQMIVFFSP